jgi:hypothetical protein
MHRFLAPIAQLNSKLERLLSQRSFGTLCHLHKLGYWGSCFRVCTQLLHISLGVLATRDGLLLRFLKPRNVPLRENLLTTTDIPSSK